MSFFPTRGRFRGHLEFSIAAAQGNAHVARNLNFYFLQCETEKLLPQKKAILQWRKSAVRITFSRIVPAFLELGFRTEYLGLQTLVQPFRDIQ